MIEQQQPVALRDQQPGHGAERCLPRRILHAGAQLQGRSDPGVKHGKGTCSIGHLTHRLVEAKQLLDQRSAEQKELHETPHRRLGRKQWQPWPHWSTAAQAAPGPPTQTGWDSARGRTPSPQPAPSGDHSREGQGPVFLATDVILRLGFRAMQFNLVVSTNTAGIRCWQRNGFQVVGYVDALVMVQGLVEAPKP
jgi:hypothetical protein